MGTLAAIPVAGVVHWLDISQFWFLLLTLAAGTWICNRVTVALGVEDYGGIVLDEMVGFWIVVAFVPFSWAWWVGAFVVFRVFDILKPWPISLVEDTFSGGLGIMLDDVLAAIYSLLILKFVERILTGF